MVKKVKIFVEYDNEDLEDEINKFIEKEVVEVIDLKIKSQGKFLDERFVGTLIYEKKN